MGSIAQPTEDWESIAKAKQADAYAQIPEAWRLSSDISSKISSTNPINVLDIPRTCGILSKLEIEITEQFTATELVRHIASRRYTAVEVTKAFSKRAAIAQQLVMEILLESLSVFLSFGCLGWCKVSNKLTD